MRLTGEIGSLGLPPAAVPKKEGPPEKSFTLLDNNSILRLVEAFQQ